MHGDAGLDGALSSRCAQCGLTSDAVEALVRHLDHVASGLPALDQRVLRSHLFGLLAGLDAPVTAANE